MAADTPAAPARSNVVPPDGREYVEDPVTGELRLASEVAAPAKKERGK